MESFGKKVVLSMAIAAVLILGTIGTALGYTPPSTSGGSTPAPVDAQCAATKLDFDGNLTLIDTTFSDVGVDFWWRGTDPGANIENWTLLRGGIVFNNTFPALVGALWVYSSDCTPEQVDQLFAAHVAERQADPSVSGGEFVPWDQTGIFVSMDGHGCVITTTPDGITTIKCDNVTGTMPSGGTVTPDPVPATSTVVTGTTMCPTDASVYGSLLEVCVDDTNPVATADNCFVHQSYAQEGGPEVSTAGPYLSVRYTGKTGNLRWVLLSHGIYNVASRLPDDAWVTEYGVNCTFGEVLALITADIQSQQNSGKSIAEIPVVAWNQSNGLFGLETNDIPYFGGTVNPDTDTTCHAEKAKGGIMERRSVIGKDGFFTLVEPWAPGQAPEYNSVLDPGQWHLTNNVHGSFWYYSQELCDRGQVEAQARAQANRREKHGNVGYRENANHFGAFFKR